MVDHARQLELLDRPREVEPVPGAQAYGQWTILAEYELEGSRFPMVHIRCGCGLETHMQRALFIFRQRKNTMWACQPCRRQERQRQRFELGHRFGRWMVERVDQVDSFASHDQVHVRCDCGEVAVYGRAHVLKSLSHLGCRTCRYGQRRERTHVGNMPRSRHKRLCQQARKRGIGVFVTAEEMWSQWQRQKGRCAYSGRELDWGTASLDRRDSAQPYTLTNVQWVHKKVNAIKMDLTHAEFIALCRDVAAHAEP